MRPTLILLTVAGLFSTQLGAQETHRGTSIPVILGAVGGSFAGVAGGSWLGGRLSEAFDIGRGGDDPGVLLKVLGAGAGSVVATALAAELGNQLMGHQPVPLGNRIRDAGAGMILGLAAGYLSARIAEPNAGKGWRIGYSSAQGLYAGLSNGRW